MGKHIFLIFIVSILCPFSIKSSNKINESLVNQYMGLADANATKKNIYTLIEKKVERFKAGVVPQTDLNILPTDFKIFYKNFVSDSIFEYQHVQFDRYLGVISECDTTILLAKDNWERNTEKFFDSFYILESETSNEKYKKSFFLTSDKILFEFEIIEIGIYFQIGFEKIDDAWKETLYFLSIC